MAKDSIVQKFYLGLNIIQLITLKQINNCMNKCYIHIRSGTH